MSPSRSSTRLALLALALLLVLGVLSLAQPPVIPAHAAAIDPAVYTALDASPSGEATFLLYLRDRADLSQADAITDWEERGWYVYRALHTTAARSQTRLLRAHRQGNIPGHISEFEPYWIANVIVVHGDRQALTALASQPEVARVLPEVKLEPPLPPVESDQTLEPQTPARVEWGVEKIGAPTVWGPPYNATGEGIVVGFIDTGVQWDHPALKTHYRGWNSRTNTVDHDYSWFNPEPERTCNDAATGTCDWGSHGTHVTGIAVGDDGAGNQIGVAPGAQWIQALGCCPSNAAALASFQWMLAPTDRNGADPNPAMRPHVLNNSWGGPGGSVIFNEAMAVLRHAGVMSIGSAGNEGAAGCGTLGSPGDNPATFSVGATTSSDGIASFSSRGPNPFDKTAGPDVTAPGTNVRSAIPDSSFGLKSGTSMAAPHLTGAAALLLSAEPDLIGKIDQVEEILRRTAAPLVTSESCAGVAGSSHPNNTFGWGRINIAAAVKMVWRAGTLRGVVADVVTGEPIADAQILADARRS